MSISEIEDAMQKSMSVIFFESDSSSVGKALTFNAEEPRLIPGTGIIQNSGI